MKVWKAEKFWAYSLTFYKNQRVQSCCLALQDRYRFNVNLMLLCCYLNQAKYQLDKTNIDALENNIADTESRLNLQRKIRREAKGTAEYKQQLDLELALEKVQQSELISALNSQSIIQGNLNNLMTYADHHIDKTKTSAYLPLLQQLSQLAKDFELTQVSGQ
jgi:uncharacterized protein (TIGR02444 family)